MAWRVVDYGGRNAAALIFGTWIRNRSSMSLKVCASRDAVIGYQGCPRFSEEILSAFRTIGCPRVSRVCFLVESRSHNCWSLTTQQIGTQGSSL
jgi:hypothetical protein